MEPDSNQQSKTSSTRRSGSPPGSALGMVMPSTVSRCRSVTRTPERSKSSCTDPMHTVSDQSAFAQMGSGVPQ